MGKSIKLIDIVHHFPYGVLSPKHVGVILIQINTIYVFVCWYIINISSLYFLFRFTATFCGGPR